ncbi:MAG: sigma-70 family RNA polymerase sigma factor [Fuerstiella sp.]|nr:sigma-70 family RNA polymerase sigma factor [Fuerstiella sp.]
MDDAGFPSPHSGRFATTRWSIVQAAGVQATPNSRHALEELCATYWYPLYAYVRRRGYQADDAQDLTQSFVLSLLERNAVQRADPDRGRFRSFLLGSLNKFLSDETRKQGAQKRGGDRKILSINVDDVENRYQLEPTDDITPEAVFERRWALTVLDAALTRLQGDYERVGKLPLFEALRGHIGADKSTIPNREVAESLSMQEGAVKVAAHRLRQEYRDALRAEIAQTVTNSKELDDELTGLFQTLSGT